MENKNSEELKASVKNHWEAETCGTRYAESELRVRYFEEIEEARYRLEPYIKEFANFPEGKGKQVLEIGVGAGTDFSNWVKFADKAYGIDLTEKGIELTRERLEIAGADPNRYDLRTSDAEHLPFGDECFDTVYSWGVLHHSPGTEAAFSQVYRVLKRGGRAKAMIYHLHSLTGLLLWVFHGLANGRPFLTVRQAVYNHLESPGTKAYTLAETKRFLEKIGFQNIHLSIKLGPGDLLEIEPSRKYQSAVIHFFWKLYPRWFLRKWGKSFGLYLLIECERPR